LQKLKAIAADEWYPYEKTEVLGVLGMKFDSAAAWRISLGLVDRWESWKGANQIVEHAENSVGAQRHI